MRLDGTEELEGGLLLGREALDELEAVRPSDASLDRLVGHVPFCGDARKARRAHGCRQRLGQRREALTLAAPCTSGGNACTSTLSRTRSRHAHPDRAQGRPVLRRCSPCTQHTKATHRWWSSYRGQIQVLVLVIVVGGGGARSMSFCFAGCATSCTTSCATSRRRGWAACGDHGRAGRVGGHHFGVHRRRSALVGRGTAAGAGGRPAAHGTRRSAAASNFEVGGGGGGYWELFGPRRGRGVPANAHPAGCPPPVHSTVLLCRRSVVSHTLLGAWFSNVNLRAQSTPHGLGARQRRCISRACAMSPSERRTRGR